MGAILRYTGPASPGGHRPGRWLAACLLAAACLAAHAAEGEVVVLDPLTIASAPRQDDTGEWLRTAALADRSAGKAASSTLATQLALLPGVVAQEGFGGIDAPRLTLRGSGLQSAPMSRGVWWRLDGLPLNATDGSFISSVIDLSLVDQIAVAPGVDDPTAAVSALGGALHLSTSSTLPAPRGWLRLGGQEYLRAGIVAGHTDDRATAHGGLSLARWEGWRPHSGQERPGLSGHFSRHFGENGPAARLMLFAARPRYDVPGPLTLEAATVAPRTISTLVATDRPRRETDLTRLAIDLTWADGLDEQTRLALAAQHTDDWFRQLRANGITASTGNDLTAQVESRRDLGEHAVRVSGLARAGRRDQRRWINAGGATGTRFADLDLEASHLVVSVDDRWRLSRRILLDAGLSAMHSTREAQGTPASAQGRATVREIAPRLALSWQPATACTITARAARAAEAPTFEDLIAARGTPGALTAGWVPLRAQTADTVELGLSWGAGALACSCTGYAARWDGELLRLADASGAARGTVNAGRTDHRGIEAALRWRLHGGEARALDLVASHTWSEATFAEDAVHRGRRLAGLPPHAGGARLVWAGQSGPFASLGATWIGGRTWADHANTLGYSGYMLAHLRLGWSSRTGWSVHAEVDNLLDRATIASTSGVIDLARNPATTALFLPGLPRQLRVGLSWSH